MPQVRDPKMNLAAAIDDAAKNDNYESLVNMLMDDNNKRIAHALLTKAQMLPDETKATNVVKILLTAMQQLAGRVDVAQALQALNDNLSYNPRPAIRAEYTRVLPILETKLREIEMARSAAQGPGVSIEIPTARVADRYYPDAPVARTVQFTPQPQPGSTPTTSQQPAQPPESGEGPSGTRRRSIFGRRR